MPKGKQNKQQRLTPEQLIDHLDLPFATSQDLPWESHGKGWWSSRDRLEAIQIAGELQNLIADDQIVKRLLERTMELGVNEAETLQRENTRAT